MREPPHFSLASRSEVPNRFSAPENNASEISRLPPLPIAPHYFCNQEGALGNQHPASMVPLSRPWTHTQTDSHLNDVETQQQPSQAPSRQLSEEEKLRQKELQKEKNKLARKKSTERKQALEYAVISLGESYATGMRQLQENDTELKTGMQQLQENNTELKTGMRQLQENNTELKTEMRQLREAVNELKKLLESQNTSKARPIFAGTHSIFAVSQEEPLSSNEITESSESQSPEACGM